MLAPSLRNRGAAGPEVFALPSDEPYELNDDTDPAESSVPTEAERIARREAAKRRMAERSAQSGRPSSELPPDAEFTVFTPKFCISCNADLTELEDPGACPRCGRPFHPGDPKTYLSEPIPEKIESYWFGQPRLAGYAVLMLFVMGRIVIGALGEGWEQQGKAAPILGAAMLAVAVPWVAGCVYLLLIVLRDYINPVFVALLPVCIALGVLLTLGTPPLAIAAAVMVGPFVALVRAWRLE